MATEFGKYILQHKLAEGGMAEVFLAKQSGTEGFEKPVVVKRILPHLCSDENFVQMFLNEGRVAARLSHPSIVQVFDFGKVGDQFYIAMEFIHGEDIRSIAKQAEKGKQRPSFALVSRIVADMLGGLHYAHTRAGSDGKPLGLVHRDISPQNVLVTFEGGVKLVDFGIAKATESQSAQQTQAGLLKGKYAYMSPEQCRGKKLDARSDVFAVGILLWELVTWRRLFRRDNDLATLVAVADDPIPTLSSIRSDVPAELDRICARALERDLGARYPSAQAMQADLEGLIRRYAWEADSISLQRYMRELFREKLELQDEAVRAAGLGSLEDFLVHVEEGTQIAWIDSSPNSGNMPLRDKGDASGPVPRVAPPAPVSPQSIVQRPSTGNYARSELSQAAAGNAAPGPRAPAAYTPGDFIAHTPTPTPVIRPPTGAYDRSQVAPVPAPRPPTGVYDRSQVAPIPRPPNNTYPREEVTPSTMRHAVGQKVAIAASSRTIPGMMTYKPPASGFKRLLIVGGTGILLGAAGLTAVFWPDSHPVPPISVSEPDATITITLDLPAEIRVDGVLQPLGKEATVKVTAQKPHEVRIKRGGEPEHKETVPALEPFAVYPIKLTLGKK